METGFGGTGGDGTLWLSGGGGNQGGGGGRDNCPACQWGLQKRNRASTVKLIVMFV